MRKLYHFIKRTPIHYSLPLNSECPVLVWLVSNEMKRENADEAFPHVKISAAREK